ncbi:MAG TPA: hypothetical protein VFS67_08520 [Polyangiaceae bacterium]|jgi:hypothetical protein|nr:hypothetical protein [Polyangiaceae bacterium]
MFRNILSLAGLSLALGCTPFEPGTDELPEPSFGSSNAAGSSAANTTAIDALTAEPGHDWSCVGALNLPPMVARSTANAARLVQSIQILSLVTGAVPKDVSVRACAQRDLECNNPVSPSVPLDAQGYADLSLYDGFDGYLEIQGPEIVSTILFYQDALALDARRDTTPLGVVERDRLPMLTAAIGSQQEPQLGLVYLRAFDCQNEPAVGVRYRIDRSSVPFYFVAGLPSGTSTETERSGLGGFINVPTGIAVVNAELSSGAKPIALPKSLLVRANWMTGLRILPSLRPPEDAQ